MSPFLFAFLPSFLFFFFSFFLSDGFGPHATILLAPVMFKRNTPLVRFVTCKT